MESSGASRCRQINWYDGGTIDREARVVYFPIDFENDLIYSIGSFHYQIDFDSPPESLEVAFDWESCSNCRGKGSYVDPSIDGAGLSSEDFDDETFRERYESGVFSVDCQSCDGCGYHPGKPIPSNVDLFEVLVDVLKD